MMIIAIHLNWNLSCKEPQVKPPKPSTNPPPTPAAQVSVWSLIPLLSPKIFMVNAKNVMKKLPPIMMK